MMNKLNSDNDKLAVENRELRRKEVIKVKKTSSSYFLITFTYA